MRKPSDIAGLVNEMKAVCRADPTDRRPRYSDSEDAALVRAKLAATDVVKSGHMRIIVTPGKPPEGAVQVPSNVSLIPVAVCLTLDTYPDFTRWTLSLSVPGLGADGEPTIPVRLEDPLATRIARCFLGDTCVEGQPADGSGSDPANPFKHVRYFGRAARPDEF
jgi:hypothetical protein